jgi:hypothetical protein
MALSPVKWDRYKTQRNIEFQSFSKLGFLKNRTSSMCDIDLGQNINHALDAAPGVKIL